MYWWFMCMICGFWMVPVAVANQMSIPLQGFLPWCDNYILVGGLQQWWTAKKDIAIWLATFMTMKKLHEVTALWWRAPKNHKNEAKNGGHMWPIGGAFSGCFHFHPARISHQFWWALVEPKPWWYRIIIACVFLHYQCAASPCSPLMQVARTLTVEFLQQPCVFSMSCDRAW